MRVHPPEELLGTTAFSQDAEVLEDPIWLILTVRSTGAVMRLLDEGMESLNANWGRHRDPGNWALIFLAFAMSDSVDIQPWHAYSSADVWRAAGFPEKPPYKTCYENFVALEKIWQVFEQAAGILIQQARRHEPRIGQHLHVDGCEAETHAAVIHDYANCDACPAWVREQAREAQARAETARVAARNGRAEGRRETVQESRRRRRLRNRALRRRPMAERPPRINTDDAKKARQAENELPVEEAEAARAALIEPLGRSGGVFRFRGAGGHVFKIGDESAGVRAYTNSNGNVDRFWPGFMNEKVICHFVRAPIVVRLYPASVNEDATYDELLDTTIGQLGGELPEAMVGDRGFSKEPVFARNTQLGIASVIDWRAVNGADYRRDHLTHDRHGVPRCKHCGAPGKRVRFSPNGGNPRIWFKCSRGTIEPCRKVQSISCSADWKTLLPLWRNDLIYFELKVAHESMEGVHDYWRDRYQVAPKDSGTRPKRIGIGWQQLRASAALLIEWTRICYREGWLASARAIQRSRRNAQRRATRRAYRFPELGQEALDGLLGSRRANGLDEPYGPNAVEVYGEGTVDPLPPSERPGAVRRGSITGLRRRRSAASRDRGDGRTGRSRGGGRNGPSGGSG